MSVLMKAHTRRVETALTHFSAPDESKLDTDTSNLTITIRTYCGGVSDAADSACLPIE